MNRTSNCQGLQTDQLNFFYGPTPCLQDITISIEPGSFFGLIGPNGSGKSTLLDLISGYLKPDSGLVQLNGKNLQEFKRSKLAAVLTLVPQSFTFNFDFDVYETVMMGRYPHIARFSAPQQSDCRKVDEALKILDICHLAQRSIRQLSGGEKQRVMIARALAQDTDYILLDEVTANLDISHAITIMKTMKDLVKKGKTVIAAIHDLNMALAFCDQVIVLNEGRLVQSGPGADIINETMVADIYQVPSEIIETADGRTLLSFKYR